MLLCLRVCSPCASVRSSLQSHRSSIMDFLGPHHWASASELLMTAFNLCRGPVSGSQSISVCAACLCNTQVLQTQRASASFSCGCLRVTSPVNPAGQSFYTAALSTPHFTTQHAAKALAPLHCAKLRKTHTKTQDDIVLYERAQGNTQDGTSAWGIFSSACPHLHKQTKVHTWCRPSVRSVGDKGCRTTGGPRGAEQVICLKQEQTEHTPT